MQHRIKTGLIGVGLGLTLAWGMGSAQPGAPAPQPDLERVERELALLHGGLFRDGSMLPEDPARSIEQMLEDQGRALERLQSRLAGLDTRQLDVIQQRLADFERSMSGLDTSGVGRIDSEVQQMRRSMDELSRTVEGLERDELPKIQRTLDDLQRTAERGGDRSADSLKSELRDLKYALQNVQRTVESIERKIP